MPTHDERGRPIPEGKRQVTVRRPRARLAAEEAAGGQVRGVPGTGGARCRPLSAGRGLLALLAVPPGRAGPLRGAADRGRPAAAGAERSGAERAVESLRLRRRGEASQGELRRLARELRALLPAPLLSITVRSPPPAPGQPLPLWGGRLAGAVSSLAALLAHAEGARVASPAAAAPPAAAGGQPREPAGSLAQRESRQCGVCVRSLRGAFEPGSKWGAAEGKAAGGSGAEAASDSGISCEEAVADGGGSPGPGPGPGPGPERGSLRKERIVMLFLSRWRRSASGPAPGDPRGEAAGTGEGGAARLARQRAAIQRLLGGCRNAASRRPSPPAAPRSPRSRSWRGPGGGRPTPRACGWSSSCWAVAASWSRSWVRHDPEPRAQFLPELLELARLVSLRDQYLCCPKNQDSFARCAKKPINTQSRDVCLFRVCAEMGPRW